MNAGFVAKSAAFLVFVSTFCFSATTESSADEPGQNAAAADDSLQGKAPGEGRDDNGLRMKLVWCPPGALTMTRDSQTDEPAEEDNQSDEANPNDKTAGEASTAEKTSVKVFLTRGYWLGKYEVTQSQWKQVMQTEPWLGSEIAKQGPDFPATFVSSEDALEFCRKLTKQERDAGRLRDGWEFTLPTEAQWERACRARTETAFSFGDDESHLGDYAWTAENTSFAMEPYAHRVGQKKPNPWGLYDMHGNVAEWCRDGWTRKLPGGRDPEVELDEETGQTARVIRGGAWDGIISWSCRSEERFGVPRRFQRSAHYGFRVALCPVRQPSPRQPEVKARRASEK